VVNKLYKSYPAKAKIAARDAWIKSKIKGTCNNDTGMVMAEILMNGNSLHGDVVKKIHSYLSRAKVYVGDEDACGTISYDLWGGHSMLQWTTKILNNDRKAKSSKSKV